MTKLRLRSLTALLLIAGLWAGVAIVQASRAQEQQKQQDPNARPRTADGTSQSRTTKTSTPAPQSVKAKYEGGIFGYRKKVEGTLSFDEPNQRLLFRNQSQKEVFSIPYEAVTAAFADTQSKRPGAAGAIGHASIYTMPALLLKKKYRYLTLSYHDHDTQTSGNASFKLQNKEVLESVLATLVNSAQLTARGEIYVKRRNP